MLNRGFLKRLTVRKVIYREKERFHILSVVVKFSCGYTYELM